MENAKSSAKTGRVGLLDELRGFAILCMIVYHLMFNLKFMLGFDVPIFFDSWFNVVRDSFAGLFITISGIVCNYSKSNIKRGAQCFVIAMVVTFVTAFAMPESPDMFGILHCLGISMLLYGLGEGFLRKIPAPIGIAAGIFLFILTFNIQFGFIGINETFGVSLPDFLYQSRVMFPLGMPHSSFSSLDYFPLLPWFFLFLAGAYFGGYVKKGILPQVCYKTHVKFFAFCGRHSLIIYIAHQPIILAITYIILAI